MINSVYGKTVGSLQKRRVIEIVNNEKDYLKHVNKPTLFLLKSLIKLCCYS